MYLRGLKIIVYINFPKIPPGPGQVGSTVGTEGIDGSVVSSRRDAHASLYTRLALAKPGPKRDSRVTQVLGVALTPASLAPGASPGAGAPVSGPGQGSVSAWVRGPRKGPEDFQNPARPAGQGEKRVAWRGVTVPVVPLHHRT